MKKYIKINNKKAFQINTSTRWLRIYRDAFGHDILPDIIPALDAGLSVFAGMINDGDIDIDKVEEEMYSLEFTVINNVIWALAKNANEDIEDIEEWEDKFDKWPLDEILPQVVGTLAETYLTTKKSALLKEELIPRLYQLTKSSSPLSTEG